MSFKDLKLTDAILDVLIQKRYDEPTTIQLQAIPHILSGRDVLASVDLSRSGITAEAFHGDKSQHARVRSLSNLKNNQIRILVATDIAARGIDIADLTFVINYELPDSAETYTRRIGRTGRAGASGYAPSLCNHEEKGQLKNINRVLSHNLQVIEHPFA